MLLSEPFRGLPTDEEIQAINDTMALLNLPQISSTDSHVIAERLKRNDTVYHSRLYRRKGKSCSYIIQHCNEADVYAYCEVQFYIAFRMHQLWLL